ncbi:UNVERIFIED_CONTAM: hypothetical protein Scaly_0342000 [Sesamum calycinum]|uniref:Uncharacterized protein n=1 Tax=Sesamum calycinum TaxID=2727403 RepID=A0AAW2SBP5_9LAMI
MVRVFHASLPFGSSAHISKTKKMGASSRQDYLIKVVHPGRHVEVFREPITAGEIMSRYPRHCIARPDVFKYPWIVVHPESFLVPGKVFYLLPYHTLDCLLKTKRQQRQSLPQPRHQEHDRCYRRQSYPRNVSDQENQPQAQDSGPESLYKLEFYQCWDNMRRSLNQPQESCYDSTFEISRSGFSSTRSRRPRSPENHEMLRLKPCLRKPDTDQKRLNRKVSFTSPVVIPSSRRGSPSDQQSALVLQV